jgi:hypothetical protein
MSMGTRNLSKGNPIIALKIEALSNNKQILRVVEICKIKTWPLASLHRLHE